VISAHLAFIGYRKVMGAELTRIS